MNKMINNKLQNIKTKSLSQTEKDSTWQGISNNMNKQNNLSIFNLLLIKNPMFNIVVALLLILSGSIATVQASDDAKPGDALYGVDRAVENIQIIFASKENKDKLKVKFAEERVIEIQLAIDESVEEVQQLKEIEVKIYPNQTIVKAESVNGRHFNFSLDTNDQTEIIKLIAERFETTIENIQGLIKFEIKDENYDLDNDDDGDYDDSDDDSDDADSSENEELEESVEVALAYMIKVRNELFETGNETAVANLDKMIEELKNKLDNLPEDIKVKVEFEEEDGKTEFKIEFKDEDSKLKLEYKSEDDGKIKIKLENEIDDDEDKDHEDDEDEDEDEGDEDSDDHDDDKDQDDDYDHASSTNDTSNEKIKICHKDDKEDPESLEILEDALESHLEHGDHIGECNDDDKDHEDEEDEEDEDEDDQEEDDDDELNS